MKYLTAEILTEELMEACLKAVRKADIDSILELAPEFVKELSSKGFSLDFKSIRTEDDYLAHHSVCVAIYAVAIAAKIDNDESFLCDVAVAGLLHDIGKQLLGLTALDKKDVLTKEEFDDIKSHPRIGCQFVAKEDRILPLVGAAILHHHENFNGTGYPIGLAGEEIPLLARILHVADVYDAIMSKKIYKKGMSNVDALTYINGGKLILFDEQIVGIFNGLAVLYPAGIDVMLSNGETGRVERQTTEKKRPVVLVSDGRMVDLLNEPSYSEVTVVGDLAYLEIPEGEVGVKSLEAIGDKASSENTATPGASATKKTKIMIVDDVYMSIAHTKRALGENYEVVYCKSGREALMMVPTEKPDLILMDYEMIEMDGVATTNELRKRGHNMPVIFLTGKGDRDIVCQCIKCGAADYILKPANPVYLHVRVEKALVAAKGRAIVV